MNTKRTLLFTSSSALAAGMAQAAVQYTPPVNFVIPLPPTPSTGYYLDLNNDGIPDFGLGFSGYAVANHQKPYIFGYPTGYSTNSAALARFNASAATYGMPVAGFGTLIDQNYLAPNVNAADSNHSYFDQDGNGKYVGDWLTGAKTEGYIGLQMFNSSITNYGWAHIIFDDAFADGTPTLTIVDYAYEDGNMVGIVAGSTNTVGAPIIYSQPQPQAVPAGAPAQLAVLALANPAPHYQWMARTPGGGTFTNLIDGGAISGSTSATLSINGALPVNALDYIVVITNTLGAVTSGPPATLTLEPPVAGPAPQFLFGGLTAGFRINAASGLPATYQWRRNNNNLSDGARITGSATPNLSISNLQGTDAGNYDVVLTAGSYSVTSSVAQLTVLPASSESMYEAAVTLAHPIAYYRLNETTDPTTTNVLAYDNVGAYNGIYGLDVTNGFSGIAGPRPGDGFPGFAANNLAARFATNDMESMVTVTPWNLNGNVATFTAWINPANSVQDQMNGIVMTGTTNSSFAGIRYYFQTNNATGWDIGFAWSDIGDASTFWDSQIAPPANQWSLVGLVVTPSNATMYVFNTSGVKTAQDANANNLVATFATPEYIGTNPDGVRGSRNYEGTIDEVAVFNRVLDANELQTLYNAALGLPASVSLQISRSGSNLQLTWGSVGQLLEASSVSGPWITNSTATSPYFVSPTNSQRFYRILVH